MDTGKPKTLAYKRSHFVTHLPETYLYSPSHCWMAEVESGVWRVGLTKFATRMLGEMVDYQLELAPGSAVQSGQIIGWIEGFKAISDIYSIAEGTYLQSNPILKEKISLVSKDCYGEGWLYMVKGMPDPKTVDVKTYQQILDKTIDKILEKEKSEEQTGSTR
ncbi:MAG: glycine cleavage system protein H [Verrucomicrobiales bacterium]